MTTRFIVRGNGCGGFRVVDKKAQVTITECSHRRNADIACGSLNGERDAKEPLAEWFRFYGVQEPYRAT